MPPPQNKTIRTRALGAVTVGLALAYLLAALAFAQPGYLADFAWPGRFDFGPSLLLAVLVLYGGAWVMSGQVAGQAPRRAGWLGALYGVLILLAAVVLAGSWNAAQNAIRFAPFPGTTGADFRQHVGSSCYDYIVKPLVWVMPLGSIVAAALGWWAGRRMIDQ